MPEKIKDLGFWATISTPFQVIDRLRSDLYQSMEAMDFRGEEYAEVLEKLRRMGLVSTVDVSMTWRAPPTKAYLLTREGEMVKKAVANGRINYTESVK